ncbi:MAG: hypothetical protein QXJ62_03105 [Nitrososphaeria archaeon]
MEKKVSNEKSVIFKKIYDEAYSYLLSFNEINKQMIEKHLKDWKINKVKSMSDVYLRMLKSIINKQGMPNSIGNIEDLRTFLENFNPRRVLKKYRGNWKKLFMEIKKSKQINSRMEINIPQNFWVIFCKGATSAASYLAKFKSLEEFREFIDMFLLNEYTRLALPFILANEIDGFGFALACDFLKEIGYPHFAKPDVHIIKIFTGIGISKSSKDYDVFIDVVRFSKAIHKKPYEVDKLFWLVGSGNFYLSKIKINTNRDKFINDMKQKYGSLLS